jgi:hypothetical protein
VVWGRFSLSGFVSPFAAGEIEMADFYELRLTIHFEKVDGLPAREHNTKFRKRFVVFRIQREA